MRILASLAFNLFLVGFLSACVSARVPENTVLLEARPGSIAENQLLDIDIQPFVPLREITATDNTDTSLENLRETESYYVSFLLAETFATSQHFGVTRVNPLDGRGAEVIVSGEILQSDGETTRVSVQVSDATGKIWLERLYTQVLDEDYFRTRTSFESDPFQPLFNSIVNDVIGLREKLGPDQLLAIRQIARLNFASRFSRETVAPYLTSNRGVLALQRLPPENDPEFSRIDAIKLRDDTYLDLLQSQYAVLITRIREPYFTFRRRSNLITQRLNNEILEGPDYESTLNVSPDGVIDSVGATPPKRETAASPVLAERRQRSNSLNRGAKAAIYSRVLGLMNQNIEMELEPGILEFEDRTVSLNGTVEEQYQQWQEVLADMFRSKNSVSR